MIYPESLKKGDVIKLISPSNGVKKEKINELEKAIEILKKHNYVIVEDQFVKCSNNGMSASSELRCKELNKSFKDDSKALIAVSGGDFINQIMDKLNYNYFLNNIKWIQGHSDITILLYFLTTNYDIATVYNFNAKGYANTNKKMIDYAFNTLENKECFIQESLTNWQASCEFSFIQGRVIGGCLESLKDIIGTKYDAFKKFVKRYKKDGIIWYFDIANFTNEDISRTMWQLKNMGYFKYCKAILFGKINEKSFTNLSFKELIKDNFADLNIPIITSCDFGHIDSVISIVNGSLVKIKKEKNKFRMETFLK